MNEDSTKPGFTNFFTNICYDFFQLRKKILIGQSYFLSTSSQLSLAFAQIVNGGKQIKPYLIYKNDKKKHFSSLLFNKLRMIWHYFGANCFFKSHMTPTMSCTKRKLDMRKYIKLRQLEVRVYYIFTGVKEVSSIFMYQFSI